MGFLAGNSLFGSIFDVDENPVELSVWLETTWADQTEVYKLVAYALFYFVAQGGVFCTVSRR